MDPVASPIPAWNGIGSLQARHVGRLQHITVDQAIAKPDRVLLAKGVIKPDIELILVLGIGIGIERIAVESRIESTGGRQHALKESNDLRLNVARICSDRDLVLRVRCTQESRTGSNRRERVVQLVYDMIFDISVGAT